MHKIPVGVLGASGFAGRVLCDLVVAHPRLELAFAAANERRGDRITAGAQTITLVAADDASLKSAAVVFAALPHGVAATWVQRATEAGAQVVDLSSDFRPGAPGLPGITAPYGLTEYAREELHGSQVVANPGCYATAILIALLPLVERCLIPAGAMVSVSAASGTTGAGASPKPELLFAEVTENFRAYSVGNEHRHLAEMRATLARAGGDLDVVFTPHLLPVARGILATITVPLTEELVDPLQPWRERYAGEPFIHVGTETPSLRDVVYRNTVRISVSRAAGTRVPTLIVTAAIDNLLKGAAGQALQNANLLLGLDEPMGLPA
jgi:N-acetyl-gamma-glutamyl-phosphate reductase